MGDTDVRMFEYLLSQTLLHGAVSAVGMVAGTLIAPPIGGMIGGALANGLYSGIMSLASGAKLDDAAFDAVLSAGSSALGGWAAGGFSGIAAGAGGFAIPPRLLLGVTVGGMAGTLAARAFREHRAETGGGLPTVDISDVHPSAPRHLAPDREALKSYPPRLHLSALADAQLRQIPVITTADLKNSGTGNALTPPPERTEPLRVSARPGGNSAVGRQYDQQAGRLDTRRSELERTDQKVTRMMAAQLPDIIRDERLSIQTFVDGLSADAGREPPDPVRENDWVLFHSLANRSERREASRADTLDALNAVARKITETAHVASVRAGESVS